MLTSPGQTYSISVFVDPMLAELGISRTTLTLLYGAGTLGGAALMPHVGRQLDHRGIRPVLAVLAVLFPLALLGMSTVGSALTLGLGFFAIRTLGQGALGLVGQNALAVWFRGRRGLAVGLASAGAAVLVAPWPALLEQVVELVGWRAAWQGIAALTAAALIPLAALLASPRPGEQDPTPERGGAEVGWTLAQAYRSPHFWLLALCGLTTAGTITGMAFHQVSLLGERGLDPARAAANFAPQFATMAVVSVVTGRLLDRVQLRFPVAVSMTALSVSCALATILAPGVLELAYAVAIGVSTGTWRSIHGAAWPRWFGVAHVGSIQGAASRWFIVGAALGALPLAAVRDATGSYSMALAALALPPLVLAGAALVLGSPGRPQSA